MMNNIQFIDERCRVLSLKEALSKLHINKEWAELAAVDNEFATLVNSKNLTRENLLEADMTDLVRGAYYNRYLANQIHSHLGFRPLPLVTFGYEKGEKIIYRLYPHQVKALTFMRERENADGGLAYNICGGIIKMQMGLGKTLIAIAHSLISSRPVCTEVHGEKGFPTLIVVSKTVMIEWKIQGFEKFFGDHVKVLYLHGDYLGKDIDKVTRGQIVKYDFIVTTYDVCSSICRKRGYHEEVLEMGDEHTLMKGKIVSITTRSRKQADQPFITGSAVIYATPWQRVICDESQRFANPTTQTYRHIMAIYGQHKWCLTGTPIRNYETDIWAQLRFCGYTGVERTIDWKRTGVTKMKTHNLTKAILSMNYDDAGIQLPNKHEHIIYITLSGKEKQCYDYVQKTAKDVYNKMMQGLCDYACVLAIFTRLRQCSIAPYLITAEAKREKGTVSERAKNKEAICILKQIYKGTLREWIHDKNGTAGIYSKKITEIITTLKQIPKGEKVLIFSMFTSVLDLLANAYKKLLPDLNFVQIDGDTKGKKRAELLTEFRTNANIQSLFITYKVGSEGLNLTEATHVICIEPWWTNAVHEQAKARCWRIGQTKEVQIHNIYVKDSIEERVVDICKEKDEMAEAMLEGTGQKIKVGLDKTTLGRMLGVN
uniref:DEAD/SNF2-like helicase n=1 Tax=Marseillevirus LCMAC102 TaxID=2506603 RepID=A0A481YUH3_9VIRU|nr:MAG: DEAD/SNF2-like helicase [Marseillevirus LCMAC102]